MGECIKFGREVVVSKPVPEFVTVYVHHSSGVIETTADDTYKFSLVEYAANARKYYRVSHTYGDDHVEEYQVPVGTEMRFNTSGYPVEHDGVTISTDGTQRYAFTVNYDVDVAGIYNYITITSR